MPEITVTDYDGLEVDAESRAVTVTLVDGQPAHDLPTGGTANQVLAKASDADYDVAWVDDGVGGGSLVTVDADGTVTVDGSGVELATDAQLAAHEADTTGVHGITDTTALETTTGAQAKADAAEAAAEAAAASALTGHAADTTAVHGITDTAALVVTTDPRLSDARTPTTHTHDDRYYTETEVDTALASNATADRARANHTGTQAATTITGLAAIATTGDYADLSGAPTIPDSADDIGAAPDEAGVPVGGTSGQVLAKNSATDYDTGWVNPPEGGGGGLPSGPVDVQYGTVDLSAFAGRSDAVVRLDVPSHTTGDEATHPSVLHFPELWNGYAYWMAFTPYTAGNDALEDPNIAASQDGYQWETPAGLTNPLDDQAGGGTYNSDTELVISPDGLTLSCLWRTVTPTQEIIYVRSTTDGVTWTTKVAILSVDKTIESLLSPAIRHDGSQWVLYTIDVASSPNTIRRRTASSITGTWSSSTACTLTGLPVGRDPWHLSVIRLGSTWVGLLNDSTLDSSGTDGELYLMSSSDGTAWATDGTPIVSQSLAGNYDSVYRGSLVPTYENGYLELDLFHGAWQSGTPARWGIYRRRLTPIAAGITVQDESIDVATASRLDFQGAGVAVTPATGKVVVTISGGGGAGGTAPTRVRRQGAATADYAVTSTSYADLDNTYFSTSVAAVAGDEIEVDFHCQAYHLSSGGDVLLAVAVNGAVKAGWGNGQELIHCDLASTLYPGHLNYSFTVASGDISDGVVPVKIQWKVATGTGKMRSILAPAANANVPQMTVVNWKQ